MTRLTARRSYSLAAVLLLTAGMVGALVASPASPAQAAAPTQAGVADRPNIVLVLADDQPKGTMAAMPGVRSEIRDLGVTFQNGVIPTTLCCPSRSALLSGRLAHGTGVYSNHPGSSFGGWPAFRDDENQTLATELSAGGYRTGFFGKYMNGYNRYGWQVDGKKAIPPGWDEFLAIKPPGDNDAAYYDYSLIGTQQAGPFGEAPEDYSTDVLRDQAVEFARSTPSDQPFFVMLSVFGPHSPLQPAPRHVDSWADQPIITPEGVNEKDMSDKPPWLRDAPRVREALLEAQQRRRLETLRSVDEAVSALVSATGDRASNTLFIYLSDNGLMQGIHRLQGKDMPYRAAHGVPLFMRWDGVIEPGSVSGRVTANIDVTATIAEAAGVSWAMEGRSALSSGRRGVVLEAMASERHPAYCGWRSKRYLYVRYSTGKERELYDYMLDPAELNNVAGEKEYQAIERSLDRRTKLNCQPFPPDFSWN